MLSKNHAASENHSGGCKQGCSGLYCGQHVQQSGCEQGLSKSRGLSGGFKQGCCGCVRGEPMCFWRAEGGQSDCKPLGLSGGLK